MMPDETDEVSLNKQKALASIDVAMGGHVAEELFIG
jgi:ATP-dependent Zn protease